MSAQMTTGPFPEFDGSTVRQAPDRSDRLGTAMQPSAAVSPWQILVDAVRAAAALGVSERKFHELRDEPWMPRPIVLGPRQLRWSLAELAAAVANMPRLEGKGKNEPTQLLRARVERLKTAGGLA